jgi:hypothetical protein
LHWLVPEVEVGMGILIGVVATGMSLHFVARIMAMPDTDEAEAEGSPETRASVTFYPVRPLPSRRRRPRKP